MSDYLIKSIVNDGMFRAYAVNTTNLVQEAQQRHDSWSAATAALGRSLTATLLLSSSVLKGEEKLTVKINGGGRWAASWWMATPRERLRVTFSIRTYLCR